MNILKKELKWQTLCLTPPPKAARELKNLRKRRVSRGVFENIASYHFPSQPRSGGYSQLYLMMKVIPMSLDVGYVKAATLRWVACFRSDLI